MAMIQCPNCGGDISDKATKCVHCGYELVEKEKIYCKECGEELEEGTTVCPKCGCPVEEPLLPISAPQPVEVARIKVPKISKKKIIIATLIALFVIVIGVSSHEAQVQKQAQEAQRQAEEAQQMAQEYGENLTMVRAQMFLGSIEAENCINQITSVWHNSIFKDADPVTDKYTRPNGTYLEDFNDALNNLFADENFKKNISDLKQNQADVQELMGKLRNTPDQYKDTYDSIKTFYDAFMEFSNLAINPSGNYRTYSDRTSEADQKVMSAYQSTNAYFTDNSSNNESGKGNNT